MSIGDAAGDVDFWDDRACSLWPVRPAPRGGELLSGWLARTALANGLAPRSLFSTLAREMSIDTIRLRKAGIRHRIASAWVDHCYLKPLAEWLAPRLGQGIGRIHDLALCAPSVNGRRGVFAALASVDPSLLRPHAIEADRAHEGWDDDPIFPNPGAIGYCPACLETDPFVPAWHRFRWARACLVHGVWLHDRCPRCRRSWAPHALDRLGPLSLCAFCGTSLMAVRHRMAPTEALWIEWCLQHRVLSWVASVLESGAADPGIQDRRIADVIALVRREWPARLRYHRSPS